MRPSGIEFVVGIVVLATLLGCKQSPRIDGSGGDDGRDCGSETLVSSGSRVSFYGDLFPILNSNFRDRVYKCTTCHAEYRDPAKLANVPELMRVIDSMKTMRMPRGGNPVPPDMIELFAKWRLDGFNSGKPGDNPSDAGLRAGVSKLLHRDCSP